MRLVYIVGVAVKLYYVESDYHCFLAKAIFVMQLCFSSILVFEMGEFLNM
jgi:hypothetical protein